MDKVQQPSHQSRGPQQDINAPASQEEFQTSSLDLLSADGFSTQHNPKRLMMLQRTLGNQATMQVINRKTPKATLPSGFAQRKSIIQRDETNSGNANPASQDQNQEQEEQEQEDPQSDPEVIEQDAELDTIPPEASEIQATVSSAQGGDDNSQEEEVENQSGLGPQGAPSSVVSVDLNDGPDPDDDDSSTGQSYQAVATTIKKDKKASGNQNYKPNRLGGGNLVTAAVQGGVVASKAASVGVDSATAAYLIKEGNWVKSAMPSSAEAASDDSATSFMDHMSSVGEFLNTPPLNIILPVPALLQRAYGAYMKYKHFKAFKDLAEASGGIDKGLLKQKGVVNNQKISTYGYLKARRGLWSRVAKAIMTLGQIVARVITVASGLTASMVSEGADLALALAQGVTKLAESVKGLIKIIMGKRGKNRAIVANRIVDNALGGDQDMLKFMVNSEALSKTWFAKINAATKSGVANYLSGLGIDVTKLPMVDQVALTVRPQNEQQMLDYLQLCQRLGLLTVLTSEVSNVMKST